MWKNLRDGKERRALRNVPSGAAAPESIWTLYKYMSFMEKHMSTRRYTYITFALIKD